MRRYRRRLTAALLWMFAVAAGAQDDSNFDIAGMQALRGKVVGIAGTKVSVKLGSGATYTVLTGPNTHFVKNAEAATTDPARPGDTVLAGGEMDAKKYTLGAVFLAVVDAGELAQLDERRAQWGKTWLAGTVIAKNGTTMSVERPDGVKNRVEVTEDTSFRRRHQSITYPEVHVGDGMTATGAMMHGGIFTAKVLTVVDAAMIREWARIKN